METGRGRHDRTARWIKATLAASLAQYKPASQLRTIAGVDTWYMLSLGDALTAQVTLSEIREAYEAVTQDVAAAVFTRQVSGPLHCEVTAYFSPAAAGLARRFGGTACVAPGRRGLELLAGPADCALRLFC